jgi:hypothetical protein
MAGRLGTTPKGQQQGTHEYSGLGNKHFSKEGNGEMGVLQTAALAALILFGTTLGTNAAAQTATDRVELSRAVIQAERKMIVAKTMELTDEEGRAFWPVYNAYWAEMNKVLDRRAKLILDFADHWGRISNDKARSILDEFLKIREQELKVMKSHVKKFRKVLPDTMVTRYFQVENKLDAMIDLEVARQIPLLR